MAINDLVGWVAAGLVLATFCAKRMVVLRAIAIVSNLAFILYGYYADLCPILVLHSILLPVNAARLREALIAAAGAGRSRSKIPLLSAAIAHRAPRREQGTPEARPLTQ